MLYNEIIDVFDLNITITTRNKCMYYMYVLFIRFYSILLTKQNHLTWLQMLPSLTQWERKAGIFFESRQLKDVKQPVHISTKLQLSVPKTFMFYTISPPTTFIIIQAYVYKWSMRKWIFLRFSIWNKRAGLV